MSKSSKVKVLQAFSMKQKWANNKEELAFKVQIGRDQNPINMTYEQLKYTYPNALIDFYETRTELFKCDEEKQDEEPIEDQELFDYDSYSVQYGSKILEHINSFTLSLRLFGQKGPKKGEPEIQRVFGHEALNFHLNYIRNGASIIEEQQNHKK